MDVKKSKSKKGFFKAFIPLKKDKSGKVGIFEKTIGDKKVLFLRGEASNTKVDKANERVSKKFIEKMKSQLQGVNVFAEHERTIEKTLGYVDDTNEGGENLIVDTALEDSEKNELVKMILDKIDHGTKMFYSIAGKITKATKKFDEKANKVIKDLIDGEIYEVSITALPEGNVGFISPIMKSMNDFLDNIKEGDDDEVDVEEVMKALNEMIESRGIYDKIYDMFSAFREATYKITNDNDLKPADKKAKILNIANEYANEIESLSSELAILTEQIESELTVTTT